MIKQLFIIFLIAFVLIGCKTDSPPDTTNSPTRYSKHTMAASTPSIEIELINSYPHDMTSFTEGFLVFNGELYESTGATKGLPQTRSLFGVVNIANGKIDVKAEIDKQKYFGEGITILNNKLFQLTYKSRKGFIYDVATFENIGEFNIPSNEGWGLCTDGIFLIMSDGTDLLTYLDPTTLNVIKTVSVNENGLSRNYLNELEYISGFIYANIWTTNTIVKINPANGNIVGKIDLTVLANDARDKYPGSLEMNGIAYDPKLDYVLITGKLWPKIYVIKFDI